MEKSIITIATGGYVHEAVHLIESIRNNGGAASETPVLLYTDRHVPVPRNTEIILLNVETRRGSMRFAHRTLKARIYSNLPSEKAAFVDSDVECFGDFSELFENYCKPFEQYGAPDGWNPIPRDMARKFMFETISPPDTVDTLCAELFGEDYLTSDLPPAWNVGVLPMHYTVGKEVGPMILSVFDAIESWPNQKYKSYTSNFDEQIPLNYSLWKKGIPTFDMPIKFNTTKSMVKRNLADLKETVFLHMRKSRRTGGFYGSTIEKIKSYRSMT